jgi:L-alanine-DL-glutamate epimerase-like enolase superfamily enzyme
MPHVTRLDLYHVLLPLKKSIRHASHERASSDSLIARVSLNDGSVGFGEGVPRPYVTGETVDSALEMLSAFDVARAVGCPTDIESAVEVVGRLTLPSIEADPRGMYGNAARSALELAILDAFGRSFGRTMGEIIRIACRMPELLTAGPTRVRYSGAITAESRPKELISAFKMWLNNFHQVKLKVGVPGQDDARRFGDIRKILRKKFDIRLDANESWQAVEVVSRLAPLARYRPTAIEQPVAHAEVESLAEIRKQVDVPVMLDESLCGYPDGERAVAMGTADLFNVRISKCGGIVPTLRLVELAQRNGLGVQLGCHPGESGILSAAGRHFASNIAGLRYVEGSYDRHVLARNVVEGDLTFGFGGWARPIKGPGLGISVDIKALEELTVRSREVLYA